MKKHLKFFFLASLMFSFSFFSSAQNTADYPDNVAGPGLQNVRVGFQTGNALGGGDDFNTFSGAFAGAGVNAHQGNSYFGHQAGLEHNGFGNTFLGLNAAIGGTSEASVHIGYETGSGTFGSTNVFIGPKAGAGRGNVNGQLYINSGDGVPLIYGDFADNLAGINTEAPLATFDVRGTNILLTDPSVTFATFPNSQAAAIGQSGGPGSSGACNLYGFRAQTDVDNAVNIGMNGNTPTVLWGSTTDDLTFAYSNGVGSTPCATRILRLGNGVGGSIYELIFDGDGRVNGSWTVISDRRLKKDVKSIGNAMDLISQLNGVSYAYKKAENPEMNLPDGRVYGFIAQEVQSVIPEVTTTSSEDGLVGVKYTEIIPLLTEGMKEQQEVIEAQEEQLLEQQTKIDQLEQRLADLERAGAEKRKESANTPSAFNNVKLSQNRPNPFSNSTTVEYEIPLEATNASLDIFSMNGQLLRSYNIEGGLGTVEIRSDALQSGTYVYAINIDGTTMATNIMLIQK